MVYVMYVLKKEKTMVQRITITIPDPLHERLQVVKDRINVSRVCQDALMKTVEGEELKMKDIPEREKLVARLRTERAENENYWKDRGVKEGKEDALELSYDDFMDIESHLTGYMEDYEYCANHISEKVDGLSYMVERVEEYEGKESAFNEKDYISGWIDGVLEVWEDVKKEL